MIYAEGTTSNNSYINKFKRGAFYDMKPCTPCYISFGETLVYPTLETIDTLVLGCLIYCNLRPYKCTLHIMPDFHPNQYMINKCR